MWFWIGHNAEWSVRETSVTYAHDDVSQAKKVDIVINDDQSVVITDNYAEQVPCQHLIVDDIFAINIVIPSARLSVSPTACEDTEVVSAFLLVTE